MTTKKFQTFTRPFGSSDEAEGKIVLEDFYRFSYEIT